MSLDDIYKIEDDFFESASNTDVPLVYICSDENHFNRIVSELMRRNVGKTVSESGYSNEVEVNIYGYTVAAKIGAVNLVFPEKRDIEHDDKWFGGDGSNDEKLDIFYKKYCSDCAPTSFDFQKCAKDYHEHMLDSRV